MLSRFSDFENTFALMDELRRRMDGAWDDVEPSWQGASSSSRALSASSFPRINFFDGGSNLVLKADVPGRSEKDVQVTLNEGGVTISGERKVVAPEGYSAHRQERSHVKFSRSLSCPARSTPLGDRFRQERRAHHHLGKGCRTSARRRRARRQPRRHRCSARKGAADHTGEAERRDHRRAYRSGAAIARLLPSLLRPQGIDASKIDAQLSAGVLYLRPPKQEFLKPRRIDVKQG